MRELIYWDSCVFISYLEGTPGRIVVLEDIVHHIRNNPNRLLVTSAVSKVEVAFVSYERSQQQLHPDIEAQIDQMWADDEVVEIADFHELIARRARDLIRKALTDGFRMKPYDATHLATAQALGVKEFHTYDDKLDKFDTLIGIPIIRPYTEYPRLPL
ncbi:MAG: type II toxin-antitoxin system VapC family toxin [Chloroflexaceae bacterium]|nr:type II toxin-antitoxin system VapC family toxin [Chloroflexaceae bacterium]